jgi:hypothetical protein
MDEDNQKIIEANIDDLIANLDDGIQVVAEAVADSDDEIVASGEALVDSVTDSDDDILASVEDIAEALADSINELEVSDSDGNLDLDSADLNNLAFPETIDLTELSDRQVKFTISREAGFDNTVGFYEVSSEDGSVVDPLSGETIAPGEEGYQEAALANRLDFSLGTANGETTEFTTELAGGSRYASFMVIDGEIESLLDDDSSNDPTIYFGSANANADGFDHIARLSENSFGYEDLNSASNADFNDLIIEYDFL